MKKRSYEWESNEEAKHELDPITDKIVELHKALLTENGILRARVENMKQQIDGLRAMLKDGFCCGKEEK